MLAWSNVKWSHSGIFALRTAASRSRSSSWRWIHCYRCLHFDTWLCTRPSFQTYRTTADPAVHSRPPFYTWCPPDLSRTGNSCRSPRRPTHPRYGTRTVSSDRGLSACSEWRNCRAGRSTGSPERVPSPVPSVYRRWRGGKRTPDRSVHMPTRPCVRPQPCDNLRDRPRTRWGRTADTDYRTTYVRGVSGPWRSYTADPQSKENHCCPYYAQVFRYRRCRSLEVPPSSWPPCRF